MYLLEILEILLQAIIRKTQHQILLFRANVAFVQEYWQFQKLSRLYPARFEMKWQNRYPILFDKTSTTDFDHHYIYHPAWAARILAQTQPQSHTDISSSLHFCSLVSAFVPIKFYDYRPALLNLSNLTSESADLMSLPFADRSIDSLSCMHVVEHIGLGRYGDKLDPDGDLKAIAQLKRVLAPNGSLLFVVPLGKSRLQFNAHRIYSYQQVCSYFGELKLRNFALVTDSGDFVENASQELADKQTYGCGCFWFKLEK